jgi:hypothetical protein
MNTTFKVEFTEDNGLVIQKVVANRKNINVFAADGFNIAYIENIKDKLSEPIFKYHCVDITTFTTKCDSLHKFNNKIIAITLITTNIEDITLLTEYIVKNIL